MTQTGHRDDSDLLTKQAANTFLNAVNFNTSAKEYTSSSFDCSAYRKFCLLIDVDVTGAPTDIVFRVQVSNDGVTFYNLMNGPFGDLRYEDAAGDKKEAILGECCFSYIRIYALSSGCDTGKVFDVTVIGAFRK